MQDLLHKLVRREDLTETETAGVFETLMSEGAEPAQVAALLMGLAAKGPAAAEIAGAAAVMRAKSLKLDLPDPETLLDTCGTGGDVKGTFNISTAAALLAAACGVKVVKHGNRSASSKSGSADVLEALGVTLGTGPDVLAKCVAEANVCFAYARAHHPAMKHVAPVRQALGIPTLFNVLGPLTNPANAGRQLLGVYAPHLTTLMAEALRRLGTTRAWVVHAEDGLDELSTMCPTHVADLDDGQIREHTIDPQALGLEKPELSALQVGSAEESAAVLRGIVDGQPGPCRDIACLNAAAALVVAGRVPDLKAGLMQANNVIDNGDARRTLDTLVHVSAS